MSELEPTAEGATATPASVVVLEAPLLEAKRLRATLAARGIAALVVKPPAAACCGGGCGGPKFWVQVDGADADAVRLMLAPRNDSVVADFNEPVMTCPACLTRFATGPLACPDCGLGLG